jgi:hypothetical protein
MADLMYLCQLLKKLQIYFLYSPNGANRFVGEHRTKQGLGNCNHLDGAYLHYTDYFRDLDDDAVL